MSSFRTSDKALLASRQISSDPSAPTVYEHEWPSFGKTENDQYLIMVNGYVNCPEASGYVTYDAYMNGVKISPDSRPLQNTEHGSSPFPDMPYVNCVNCVQSKDADGNDVYTNKAKIVLTWIQPPNMPTSAKTPTANNVQVNVIVTYSS